MKATSPTDSELVRRLNDGDAAALATLAERYRAALTRFAFSMLGDEGRAEVAQEAVARLAAERRPEGPPRAWLYKVTRNLALDLLRSQQISPTGRRLPSHREPPADTAGPATRVADAERRALVRRILDEMPEEYATVLRLKHEEGLSRAEIAEVLEISEIAVKGRLVRAAEYLRQELRRLDGSTG
jgi:RNA polymerase sigma-70 factor (ECF subfamily)